MSGIIFFKDAAVDSAAKVLFAMLPLITIGMMGMRLLLWLSVAVGVLSCLVMIIRIVLILKKKQSFQKNSTFAKVIGNLLGLPYALVLSSLILILNGIESSLGLWIAGCLALCEIAAIKISPDNLE